MITRTSKYRLRAVLAALAIATSVSIAAAGPANATPTTAPPAAPIPAPAATPATATSADTAGRTTASLTLPDKPAAPQPMIKQPAVSDTCPTVRAHLKDYAARGLKQVTCATIGQPLTQTSPHNKTQPITPNVGIGTSSLCTGENQWIIDRTDECIRDMPSNWEIVDVNSGAVLGTELFLISQHIILHTGSGFFVESVNIFYETAVGEGRGEPATEILTVGCQFDCKVQGPTVQSVTEPVR